MAVLNRSDPTLDRNLVRNALWRRGKASLGTQKGWRPDVPRLYDLYPDDARSKVCPGCGKGKAPHAEMCKQCRTRQGLPPGTTRPGRRKMTPEVLAEACELRLVDPSPTRIARKLISKTQYTSVASMAAALGIHFRSDDADAATAA